MRSGPGNAWFMREIDGRKLAMAGVIVAAVLSSCLVLPAVGRLATVNGTWLATAILGLPPLAVLVATGYRHYGPGRSIGVAVVVTAVMLVVSWIFAVIVVASALSGTATSMAMGVLLYVIPAVLVLVLGILALAVVPPRAPAQRPFEHAARG